MAESFFSLTLVIYSACGSPASLGGSPPTTTYTVDRSAAQPCSFHSSSLLDDDTTRMTTW